MSHRRQGCLVALAILVMALAPTPARAWWNPFKRLEAFLQKLNRINQGATVKDRWNNLVNAGGPGAPGASFAPGEAHASVEVSAGVQGEFLPAIDGVFETMARAASREPNPVVRKAELTAVIVRWVDTLERAVKSGSEEAVEVIWSENPAVFRLDPAGVRRAVERLARRHPMARSLVPRARRAERASRHFTRR